MSKGRGIHWTTILLLALFGVAGARFAWVGLQTSTSNPAFCWNCYAFLQHVHVNYHSTERSAAFQLPTIVSAQRDFRENDRDHNGVRDYWREDVAGLYFLRPVVKEGANSDTIRLIEQSLALADAAPKTAFPENVTPGAKVGFLYKTLLHSDESAVGPDRFAVCAYPAGPQGHRFVFILDESGVIYFADFKRLGIPEKYPSKAERDLNWVLFNRGSTSQKVPR